MGLILDAPPEEKRYAGFWIRVAAFILDALILTIILTTVFMFAASINFTPGEVPFDIFMFAVGIGYFTVMESSSRQATLGKIIVGIKVGDVNGNQISWKNALGRLLAKLLSALVLGIGFISVGQDKQGLHDTLASTYVFR